MLYYKSCTPHIGKGFVSGSILHVLRRFTARRGRPKLVLSDNATQFQLVFKILMQQHIEFKHYLSE